MERRQLLGAAIVEFKSNKGLWPDDLSRFWADLKPTLSTFNQSRGPSYVQLVQWMAEYTGKTQPLKDPDGNNIDDELRYYGDQLGTVARWANTPTKGGLDFFVAIWLAESDVIKIDTSLVESYIEDDSVNRLRLTNAGDIVLFLRGMPIASD